MKRSHGGYSKRSRLLKAKRVSVAALLKEFKPGDRARIEVNPCFSKGRPSTLRFNNRVVKVAGRQGRAYRVLVRDGGKEKQLIVSSTHLTKI